MAILNQQFEWSDFKSNPDLRNAYQGTPAKTLLPRDRLLCRFITTESKARGVRGNEIYLGPWWTEWRSTVKLLNKWQAAATTPKEVLRAKLALTRGFSQELDGLVQIVLTQPVYAWKGIARHQEDTLLKVTYMGGGEQLFLPNLASDRTGEKSTVAHFHCFSWVDSLS
jgi:hypothetical protein